MKTTELTFTEAVQAIVDGRCKKIKNEGGLEYYKNDGGCLGFLGGNGISLSPSEFLGKWSLVMPPSKWEVKAASIREPYIIDAETIQEAIAAFVVPANIISIVKLLEEEK